MHSATFIAIIQCELINISAAAIEIYLYTYISRKYNARDTPTFLPEFCIVLQIYAIPFHFLFGKRISIFSFLAAYFSAPIVCKIYRGKSGGAL